MAESGAADGSPGFDYAELVRSALLGVVRRVIERAADEGLPGDHHLYLTFGTAEAGVELSARLLAQFPDEMTIVLQHQFWKLTVDDGGFSVTLRFAGTPERLRVAWTALRGFADPSVGFGLRLRPETAAAGEPGAAAPTEGSAAAAPSTAGRAPGAPTARPEKVVELGAFRRRTGPKPRG